MLIVKQNTKLFRYLYLTLVTYLWFSGNKRKPLLYRGDEPITQC